MKTGMCIAVAAANFLFAAESTVFAQEVDCAQVMMTNERIPFECLYIQPTGDHPLWIRSVSLGPVEYREQGAAVISITMRIGCGMLDAYRLSVHDDRSNAAQTVRFYGLIQQTGGARTASCQSTLVEYRWYLGSGSVDQHKLEGAELTHEREVADINHNYFLRDGAGRFYRELRFGLTPGEGPRVRAYFTRTIETETRENWRGESLPTEVEYFSFDHVDVIEDAR